MVDVTELDVKCESCDEIVSPQGVRFEKIVGVIGLILFLFLGLVIGGSIGIATLGAGIAATFPLGLLGAYAGWKIGTGTMRLLDGVTCPECGYRFG